MYGYKNLSVTKLTLNKCFLQESERTLVSHLLHHRLAGVDGVSVARFVLSFTGKVVSQQRQMSVVNLVKNDNLKVSNVY